MIHCNCICDICKCSIDLEHELRYVIRIEAYAALDDADAAIDDDRDYLAEIHDVLEGLDEMDANGERLGDDVYKQFKFDMCADCRKKFLEDPLGRRLAQQLDFSKN